MSSLISKMSVRFISRAMTDRWINCSRVVAMELKVKRIFLWTAELFLKKTFEDMLVTKLTGVIQLVTRVFKLKFSGLVDGWASIQICLLFFLQLPSLIAEKQISIDMAMLMYVNSCRQRRMVIQAIKWPRRCKVKSSLVIIEISAFGLKAIWWLL